MKKTRKQNNVISMLSGFTGEVSAWLGDLKSGRMVVEVCDDLHGEIGKLALLNDLRIYGLTNAVIEEFLKDQERVKVLIRRLKL